MSDLVEKLRILYGICRGELRPKTYTPVADVDVMLEQAADRIEALEAELNEMSDFGKARHDEIVAANKRIEALEAALREITSKFSEHSTAGAIARRALDGKHE